VCDAAVGLFGVSGAGMMVIDENQELRFVAATDEPGRKLEEFQAAVGEGPCVDTLILDTVVTTPDVSTDDRWERLAPLIRETPVRAVLGVPARAGGGAIGAFNVYRSSPGGWDEDQLHAVEVFNVVVEALIGNALLANVRETIVQQLQFALENRVDIERAVGIIMARDNVDPVTAFNALRSQARAQRRKVSELAKDILASIGTAP
jgi:GAF domain-containing protein